MVWNTDGTRWNTAEKARLIIFFKSSGTRTISDFKWLWVQQLACPRGGAGHQRDINGTRRNGLV